MVNGLDHVANLALFPSGENHGKAAWGKPLDLIGLCFSNFGKDALFQLWDEVVIEGLIEGDVVELFDLMLWVCEGLGQLAVIAEEEEAFGLKIEPPDVHQVLQATGEEVVDRGTIMFVIARADESGWLMEDNGLNSKWLQSFPRSSHLITRLNPVRGFEADLAIHDDFSFLHKSIAGASRPDTTRGEVFIEANAGVFHFG